MNHEPKSEGFIPKSDNKQTPHISLAKVYMVVGLTFTYIDYCNERMPLEKEATALFKAKRAGKKVDGKIQAIKRRFKELRNKNPQGISHNNNIRGVFLYKAEALAAIKKHASHLHEGGYYSYLVVEPRNVGFNGCNYEKESESWFRLNKRNTAYLPCKKPPCLQGTVCFSGS